MLEGSWNSGEGIGVAVLYVKNNDFITSLFYNMSIKFQFRKRMCIWEKKDICNYLASGTSNGCALWYYHHIWYPEHHETVDQKQRQKNQ